ncbi:MAG TPA: helix-turn-helix transcriptional regulator [Trebonia sp.]
MNNGTGTAEVTRDANARDVNVREANARDMNTRDAKGKARRTELAAFLRSRRERVSPEAAGLPPGGRRRTPGLRREELAQLAGVGVTWYTWLEQGRPINVSVQVLDAIARTLMLDQVERAHLFRLAEVPGVASVGACEIPLPAEVQDVLDVISTPACVVTDRYDLLAWNEMYAVIFPRVTSAPAQDRNTLLYLFTARSCCTPVADQDAYCGAMVGALRAAYAKHVGDPAWTQFIHRMEAESPTFAAAWAEHDVAQPASHSKRLRHPGVGTFTATTTSFAVQAVPGARMTVYTGADETDQRALAYLAGGGGRDARFACWPHDREPALAAV